MSWLQIRTLAHLPILSVPNGCESTKTSCSLSSLIVVLPKLNSAMLRTIFQKCIQEWSPAIKTCAKKTLQMKTYLVRALSSSKKPNILTSMLSRRRIQGLICRFLMRSCGLSWRKDTVAIESRGSGVVQARDIIRVWMWDCSSWMWDFLTVSCLLPVTMTRLCSKNGGRRSVNNLTWRISNGDSLTRLTLQDSIWI